MKLHYLLDLKTDKKCVVFQPTRLHLFVDTQSKESLKTKPLDKISLMEHLNKEKTSTSTDKLEQ